jgi:deoxyhypusine monooxygenase
MSLRYAGCLLYVIGRAVPCCTLLGCCRVSVLRRMGCCKRRRDAQAAAPLPHTPFGAAAIVLPPSIHYPLLPTKTTTSTRMLHPPPPDVLIKSLNDPSNAIGMRMRAVYYLRQAYESHKGGRKVQDEVISTLGSNLLKATHGSLMRHEIAYVMGQLRDAASCPYLEKVLAQNDDCIMVRHECAEALGAIGHPSSLEILEKHSEAEDNRNPEEVTQTCRIAIDFVRWKQQSSGSENANDLPPVMACACMLSPYKSVDPAPPLNHITSTAATVEEITELGRILCNESDSLFQRYRAMFTLRNINSAESAIELGNALVADRTSALLRHEIAYVLGQMQNPASIPMLMQSLSNQEEHVMVRHESAEALGAMCDLGGDCWEKCKQMLLQYQSDDDQAVAER